MGFKDRVGAFSRSGLNAIREEVGAFRRLDVGSRRRLLVWGLSLLGVVIVGTVLVTAALVNREESEMLAAENQPTSSTTSTIVATTTTAASTTSTTTTLPPLEFRGVPVLIAHSKGISLGDAEDAHLVPVGPVDVAYSDMMGGLVYKDKANRTFHFPAGAAEPVRIIEGHHFVKVVSDRGSPLVVYFDADPERGLRGLNLKTNESRKLPWPSDGWVFTSRTSKYWVWVSFWGDGVVKSFMVDDSGMLAEWPRFEHDPGVLNYSFRNTDSFWDGELWVTYSGRYFFDIRYDRNWRLFLVGSDREKGTVPYWVSIPETVDGEKALRAEIVDLSWPNVLVETNYGGQTITYIIDVSASPREARPLEVTGEARLLVEEPY